MAHFRITLHIGGRCSIRNLRTPHAVVTRTHLSRTGIPNPITDVQRRIENTPERSFVLSQVRVHICFSCKMANSLRSKRSTLHVYNHSDKLSARAL